MTDRRDETKRTCYCPYCEAEIVEAAFPYCQACKVEIFYCPKCRQAIPRDKQLCPHCGADIKGEVTKGG